MSQGQDACSLNDSLAHVKVHMTDSEKNIGRTVHRAGSDRVPLAVAIQIAGRDRWLSVPKSTRAQYEREGIPASQIADDLLAWYLGQRGKVPATPITPPDPDEIRMIKRVIDADLKAAIEHPAARECEWAVQHLVQQITGLARLIAPPMAPVKRRRGAK